MSYWDDFFNNDTLSYNTSSLEFNAIKGEQFGRRGSILLGNSYWIQEPALHNSLPAPADDDSTYFDSHTMDFNHLMKMGGVPETYSPALFSSWEDGLLANDLLAAPSRRSSFAYAAAVSRNHVTIKEEPSEISGSDFSSEQVLDGSSYSSDQSTIISSSPLKPSKRFEDVDFLPKNPRDGFCCPIDSCDKKYKRKGDLKFHIIEKHPGYEDLTARISKPKSSKDGKTYPCPFPECKCGFKWERDLRRHFKRKHPNDELITEGSDDAEDAQFDENGLCAFKVAPSAAESY